MVFCCRSCSSRLFHSCSRAVLRYSKGKQKTKKLGQETKTDPVKQQQALASV